MKCPIDTEIDLVMTERSGVEIDYCPTCRGVWLDRGELDKIIDRVGGDSAPAAPPPAAAPMAPPPPQAAPPPPMRWDSSDPRYRGYPSKRKSMLKELFDF